MTTVPELLKQIGFSLKSVRTNANRTIQTHCKKTNQSESNYRNYETGSRSMSLGMLIQLADQHNCNVSVLITSKSTDKNLIQGGWG